MKGLKRKNSTRKKKSRKQKHNRGGVHTDPMHFATIEYSITGHHPFFPKHASDSMSVYKAIGKTIDFEKLMTTMKKQFKNSENIIKKTLRIRSPSKKEKKRKTRKKRKSPSISPYDIIEASILG